MCVSLIYMLLIIHIQMFKDIKPCQSIEESITMTSHQIQENNSNK